VVQTVLWLTLATGCASAPPKEMPMSGPSVSLGYVILYVPALYRRAVEAGAAAVSEPAEKPWGQTVAYVRDNRGFLVELCSPLP
jgi:uncharacterized glyoxalase superfamily protein PhnB